MGRDCLLVPWAPSWWVSGIQISAVDQEAQPDRVSRFCLMGSRLVAGGIRGL